MNKSKLLAMLIGLSLWNVACSKSPLQTSDAQNDDGQSMSSISCKTDGEADPSSLYIKGKNTAQAGERLNFKLNEQLACNGSQKVSWKTAGGQARTAASLTSSFDKAGQYAVVAKIESADSVMPTEIVHKTVVVSGDLDIAGPQVGMVGAALTFELAVPANMTVVSANWNFGDTAAVQSSTVPVQHIYGRSGTYQVAVTVVDSNETEYSLIRSIQIIPIDDGLSCVSELSVSGPTEAYAMDSVNFSVFMPACLTSRVANIRWNFGDGEMGSGQSTSHAYANPGSPQVIVQLFQAGSNTPWITLTHDISILERPVATPTPTPTPTPEPTPTPTPTPDLNECPQIGLQRELFGEIFTQAATCGMGGTKTNSYREKTVEECKSVNEIRKWVVVSQDKDLLSEGECQGQYCTLPDGSRLNNGETRTMYSTQLPAGSCGSVSGTRTCNNGSLSGSTSYQYLTCTNGCEGFGSSGTTKTGVIIGEVQVPKTCQFGEQGFFDTFNQIVDQTCTSGTVTNSNTRNGDLKLAGVCPGYEWRSTGAYGACSAACGGSQNLIHQCVDQASGAVVANERCAGAAPVVSRVCDGDPESVRRSETSVSSEEGGSSNLCPKNEIGVIISKRDITTVKTYACIDHSVQLADTKVTNGAWVQEKYCRPYVAYRCSQDSLSNTEATGRTAWLYKCRSQQPIIDQFLTDMEKYEIQAQKIGGGTTTQLVQNGKILYPTFMDRSKSPEKAWIAPKNANGSCVIPESVYIAAVCTASCATPEQQILAQAEGEKMKYVSFIDALTKNHKSVATLPDKASINSKAVVMTKVDQWVTEMMDTDHQIVVFKMKSGRELKLTPNHAVVTADGSLKLASEFNVGESLVQLGGVLDPIVALTSEVHHGKVYNVFVKSTSLQRNVVITNGYLNGTAYYQNAGSEYLNRQVLRNKLIRGALK